MERLKELLPLWTVLAFFAAGFGALGSISPEGTPFEDYAGTLHMVCYGAVVVCLIIGVLALILERLRRFSKYLGRGIGACAKFVRENALLVAALVAVALFLWRLFDLGRDPAVFSIVPLLVVACIALTIGLIRLLVFWTRPARPPTPPPYPKEEAKGIAFSILGGTIVEVIPYRDRDNPHQLMAVMRKPSDRDEFPYHIFILEQFGSSWRVAWESEKLLGRPDLRVFKVHDFDSDGVAEISFGFEDWGTGGGGETVHLYVPSTKRTYWASTGVFWGDLTSPLVDRIKTMEPESPDDQIYLDALESMCDEVGLVGPLPEIDLDDPQYGVLRWHKENGELVHGQVEIHLYEGFRECGGSISAQAEDNHYIWTSCFKGAVYGYMKSEDKHFVVWSPGSQWGWATSLLATDRYLWIGTRWEGLLRFDKDKCFLWQFKTIFGEELKDIDSLELDEGYLVIGHSRGPEGLRIEMELLEAETPSGVD